MRRQSKSLQVSILFAYFLFLLAGVSFDNMQKIKMVHVSCLPVMMKADEGGMGTKTYLG